jgi:lipoprotein NlpI
VLNLEPDRADVYNKLGVIYTELGSFDKAIMAFQKALRLRPDYIDAQQNMERIRNLEGVEG